MNARRVIAERLVKQNRERGMGVLLQNPECDKYTSTEVVEIDCENRLHLCHAACCKLPFALSKQDVHEGVIHWDLGQPYMIAQDSDGYCSHLRNGALASVGAASSSTSMPRLRLQQR